jgi:Calcineurin-like phosphoesterase
VSPRPTAGGPADSKPSSFPITVCESTVPLDATRASVGTRTLPVPKARPQRIVLIGDTGCRLEKAFNAWQACDESGAWPFADVAATAARFAPDLVIHIGDYHYRETACPPMIAGCRGSPWGYGWDAWEADLFVPAAPLLAAAPWIVVRGNHEECARAGQGWFRLLISARFGFVLLEREESGWSMTAHTRDGAVLTRCTLDGARLDCTRTGLVRP